MKCRQQPLHRPGRRRRVWPPPSLRSSSGLGTIESGYLEMSNVDLAGQLTDLITAQRAYEANSKVITTSDDILQTLINLKQG